MTCILSNNAVGQTVKVCVHLQDGSHKLAFWSQECCRYKLTDIKGAVSRNSAKVGNYKMPVKLRET